ncbi:MAG: hypothetical protein ACI4KG_06240, partial [Oscillospiraceae bacterium]
PKAPVISEVPVTGDAADDISENGEVVEFEETDVPLNNTPFDEDDGDSAEDTDELETFEDDPVPLGDDPFGDGDITDGYNTDVDSNTANPKTGVDMTVPRGAAAAAMASFIAMMYANRKRREERNS